MRLIKLLTLFVVLILFSSHKINYHLPEMVFVKGGTFKMGSNDGPINEKPIHKVTVSDFYISKYEITNQQYCDFLNYYQSDVVLSGEFRGKKMIYYEHKGIKKVGTRWVVERGYENYPVVDVTWFGANEYCNWLSHVTGENYRLPTEAEWEYAARGVAAGKPTKYAGTNKVEFLFKYANYCDVNCPFSWKDKKHNDGYKNAAPVGSYKPNALGIYDMSGNVMEWCWDWYSGTYYSKSPAKDPTGPIKGKYKVYRGGSFIHDPSKLRCSDRGFDEPTQHYGNLGFRVVKVVQQ